MRSGLRHPRRPAQRRQVDPAQRDRAGRRSASSPTSRRPRGRRSGACSTGPDAQIVFVDTPGIHKPVTALGRAAQRRPPATRWPTSTWSAWSSTPPLPFGRGDRFVAERLRPNGPWSSSTRSTWPRRTQVARPARPRPPRWTHRAYFPVSARDRRRRHRPARRTSCARLPEGPQYFPDDMVTDVPEAFWVAELVREQLLAVTHDELPHSIATRVTEWEWPRIRVEILVERESQKGMVIGKGGRGAQGGRHGRPGAAPRRRLPGAARQGRQGLATPPRPHHPPRLLAGAASPGTLPPVHRWSNRHRCSNRHRWSSRRPPRAISTGSVKGAVWPVPNDRPRPFCRRFGHRRLRAPGAGRTRVFPPERGVGLKPS